jgi:hypothetical protein
MKWNHLRLPALLAVCIVLSGCNDDDGPTSPGIPTPAPGANITGAWQGRFVPCEIPAACGSGTSASVTFTQTGSNVTGSLTTGSPIMRAATFQGELRSNGLNGTITNGEITNTVSGSATATHIAIEWQTGIFGKATLTFDR